MTTPPVLAHTTKILSSQKGLGIDQLKPGNSLIAHDGSDFEVLSLHNHGVCSMFRVMFSDGRKVYTTPTFSWSVFLDDNDHPETKTTQDIDLLINNEHRVSVVIPKPVFGFDDVSKHLQLIRKMSLLVDNNAVCGEFTAFVSSGKENTNIKRIQKTVMRIKSLVRSIGGTAKCCFPEKEQLSSKPVYVCIKLPKGVDGRVMCKYKDDRDRFMPPPIQRLSIYNVTKQEPQLCYSIITNNPHKPYLVNGYVPVM